MAERRAHEALAPYSIGSEWFRRGAYADALELEEWDVKIAGWGANHPNRKGRSSDEARKTYLPKRRRFLPQNEIVWFDHKTKIVHFITIKCIQDLPEELKPA